MMAFDLGGSASMPAVGRRRMLRSCMAFAIGVAAMATTAHEAPAAETVKDLVARFSAQWDESAWEGASARRPIGFMRPLDDAGAAVRMEILAALVAQGPAAVEPLLGVLRDGSVPERILAAQALGYLAPHVPREPLLAAAKDDPDAAVRIYAVDALGMRGDADIERVLAPLQEKERDRDVAKHISYALERRGEPVAAEVVERLAAWNPAEFKSAQVGGPAPAFELKSLGGETVRLADFKGRPVVLVFIYGDT